MKYTITIVNAIGRELTRDYDFGEEYKDDEELGAIMRDMISCLEDENLPF